MKSTPLGLFIAFHSLLLASFIESKSQPFDLDDMVKKQAFIQPQQSSILREKVAALNYPSMIIEERFWSCWSYYEFLCKSFKAQAEPLIQEKHRVVFDMIKNTPYATESFIKESTTWQDLNMFAGKRPGDNYVGNVLCKTKTEIGRAQFYSLLAASTPHPKEIESRQAIIKTFLKNHDLRAKLNELLKVYASSEELFLSHWRTDDQYAQNITKHYCFTDPVLSNVNDSPVAIQIKHLYSCLRQTNQLASNLYGLSSLSLCLLAVAIDKTQQKSIDLIEFSRQYHQNDLLNKFFWDIGPNAIKYGLTALSTYFLFCWTQESIDNIVDNLMFEEIIHLKLKNVSKILHCMLTITILLEKDKQLLILLPELKALYHLFTTTPKQNAPLYDLLQLLLSDTFTDDTETLFANRGKIMLAYIGLNTLKDDFLPALQAISLIDAYNATANFMEENSKQFCFAELQQKDMPYLYLEGFINPLVLGRKNEPGAQDPIANTMELGNGGPSRNCIITGPNAGGKSTLIKAIGINVLLAQSLGIAAAKKCILTPFSFVATYLNITDDINSGNSLFKAEVLRTQELINTLTALPRGQHGLLIFDEIFNGTTPLEGSAAAYAVAEFLGNLLNGITIIATHFEQLTKIEKNPNCSYKNYKVSVAINNDGSLSYPFTISKGVSRQHIALDILRNEGYSGEIITRTANILGQ